MTDRHTPAEQAASDKERRSNWWHALRLEALMYWRHLWGLALPGIWVKTVNVHPNEPKSLDKWDEPSLQLVIDEGRRQLDRQGQRFDRIRTTAQLLFTTSLALLVVLAASAHRILDKEAGTLVALWIAGLLLVALGMLGAASVLTVNAEFGTIDTAKFTEFENDSLRVLATAYAEQVGIGESTVAARLTVYRDAVWLVLLGAAVQLVVWLTSLS